MTDLTLLIELENQCKILEDKEKRLQELEADTEVRVLSKKILNAEKKLDEARGNHERISTELSKQSQRIDTIAARIKILEKTLYDGSIRDLKQLEHLEKEKNNLSSSKQELEASLFEAMENIEELDKTSASIASELAILIDDLRNKRRIIKKEAVVLIDTIKLQQEKVLGLEANIEPELLQRFYLIRSKRGSGIAFIENDICTGCNMRVATTIIDRIKTGKRVYYCESCGRIHIIPKV